MDQAGEILGATLKSMRDSNAASLWLRTRWASLIGNTLAAHIRPVTCAQGLLRLEADSRDWKSQAEAMHQEIRERINQSWRGLLVRELQVELKPKERRLAYEVDNNHLPFLRKCAKPQP